MIIRRLIIVILLINFLIVSFEFKDIAYDSNNPNSNQLIISFIDNTSLVPIETTTVRTHYLKAIFYSSSNDNSVRKLKTFPKSLQLISETESESNNRRSTFMIIESTTGT